MVEVEFRRFNHEPRRTPTTRTSGGLSELLAKQDGGDFLHAVAANTDGRREIIGLGLGPSEAETLWMDLLRGLKAHGLEGTKLVISFGGKTVPRTVFPPALPDSGLGAATERVFETPRQRCRVHRMRSAPAHVSRGRHTAVAPAIRQAFD